MKRSPKFSDEIARETIDAAKKAAAEGEMIVEKAHADFGLAKRSSDGPLLRDWKRGVFPVKRSLPPSLDEPLAAGQPSLLEMVENILEFERKGRKVSAALGLKVLRELIEALDPEHTEAWAEFAEKYLQPAIGLERVNELIGNMVHRSGLLRCNKCGAEARARCGCGVPYIGEHRWTMPVASATSVPSVPAKEISAIDRAAAAVIADPGKSDRTIAAEIGVSDQTVGRARRRMKGDGGDVAVNVAVDGRVGRDGRRRRLPGRSAPPPSPEQLTHDPIQEMHPDATTTAQQWIWSAENILADVIALDSYWHRLFGDWEKFERTTVTRVLFDQADAAFQKLRMKFNEEGKSHEQA